MKTIDAIPDVERQIDGLDVASRPDARHRLVRPPLKDLHDWMRAEQGAMSKHNPVAQAIAYMFKKDRWDALTLFLEDSRTCLTNNAPNARFAVSLWEESHGSSPARSGAVTEPHPCSP